MPLINKPFGLNRFTKRPRFFLLNAVLSLMLGLLTSWAYAEEKQLVLDNELVAIYNNGLTNHSENKTQSPKGAVLLIHGWASQMNEVGDMYLRLADQLAEQGYASLRINIRGESEREKTGFRITSTFGSRIADAQTGLDFLRKTYPKLPLGVVGFSLGGATAMALTGNNPTAIASLVLWSSAGDPGLILSGMSPTLVRTVLEKGEAVYPAWVDLTVTREHLLGMLGYDIFTPLQQYTGALLSIRGTEDFVPQQEAQIFANASAQPEDFYLIGGADHTFNTFTPSSNYDERTIAHTLRWLSETLH